MKIGLLISIREKSTRFPGKVLKIIEGQTVTEHLIDRLKISTGYDKLVIATSDDKRDKIFNQFAQKKQIEIYYGDQEDKLKRYLQIINHFGFDAVVIIDGDDILCFPEVVTKTIEILRTNNCDVIFWKNLPLGAACSGLTKSSLEKIMEIKAENDTEVWGGYFTQGGFRVHNAELENGLYNHPEVRLTLDYIEDFELLTYIFEELKEHGNKFSSYEVMNLIINKKPELSKLNLEAQKRYEEHLKKAASVKFKKDQII